MLFGHHGHARGLGILNRLWLWRLRGAIDAELPRPHHPRGDGIETGHILVSPDELVLLERGRTAVRALLIQLLELLGRQGFTAFRYGRRRLGRGVHRFPAVCG